LSAEGSQLPSGISRKDDWRFIINPSFSYIPLQSGNYQASLNYDLYQSLHTRLDKFDLNQNRIELAGKMSITQNLETSLSYAFEYLHIGGDPYAANHIITPSITASASNGIKGGFAYKFRETSYKNAPLFSSNSERSGENHSFVLNGSFPVGEKTRVRSLYQYSIETGEKSYWDSSENRISAGMTSKLPFDLLFDLSFDVAFKKYDTPQIAATTKRKETAWNTSILLSKEVVKNINLITGYTAIRNESNYSEYDYTRTITSILLQARF